jgi:hypothetical protein
VHAGAVTADQPEPEAGPHVDTRAEPLGVGRGGRLDDDAEFQTQLAGVRARLLRDAAPAGLEEARVQETIDETVRTYESAAVRSFLAVLIEREVRARLDLRTPAGSAVDLG